MWMNIKHLKSCSVSVVIKELQIKNHTEILLHFRLNFKKRQYQAQMRMWSNWHSQLENSLTVSYNVEHKPTHSSVILFVGSYLKGVKIYVHTKT